MPARLVSLNGYPNITLAGVVMIAGRHQNCDARICSPRVSRRHCCFVIEPGGVTVRDLKSANGTWINGERIEDGTLRSGDEIAIAHLRYRFEPCADPGDTAPPTPREGLPPAALEATLPPTDMHEPIEVARGQ
jgi:hypothetical protein